jgi:multidrug efflux pump subunit AcrA (membrane-fusion protein)
MKNLSYRIGRIGWAAGAAVLLAGCGLAGMGGTTGGHTAGPPVTITQATAPSALLAVTADRASGPALAGGLHAVDEWIDLAQLRPYPMAIADAVGRIMAG